MNEDHIPTTQEPVAEERFPLNTRVGLGIAAVVLLAGLGYYAYAHWYNTPQRQAQREAERIVAAVGKLIVLPTDEQPLIATVNDPAQFKDQQYFTAASKGDKVLIYNKAHKAILYNPSMNRIVDVAPFSAGKPSPTPKK